MMTGYFRRIFLRYGATLLLLPFLLLGLLMFSPSSHVHAEAFSPSYSNGTPDNVAGVECGGTRHPQPSAWTVQGSGGFNGTLNGTYCNGSFSYIRTPTGAYADYDYLYWQGGSSSKNFKLWVYIPTIDAGATVNYKTYCGSTSYTTWSLNQEIYSQWIYLGIGTLPPHLDCELHFTVSSSESSVWDMAEDAIALDITNACC